MTLCTACRGSGKVMALVNHGGSCTYESVSCSRCAGVGALDDALLEAIAQGERIRRQRLDSGLSMHDAAKARGMSVRDYSDLERGRVQS